MQEFFGKKFNNSAGFFAFRGKMPSADGVFGESGAAGRGPARERRATPSARKGICRGRAQAVFHIYRELRLRRFGMVLLSKRAYTFIM